MRAGQPIGELVGVALRDLLALLHLVRKGFELLDQDRGLERVEAAVGADPDVIVFVAALAVDAERAKPLGDAFMIGEDGAAVAVAAERLGREEAGRRDGPEGARAPPPDLAAEALGGVLDQIELVLLAQRFDCVIVGGEAEQVDRHHRLGEEFALLLGAQDRLLQRGRVDVEGARIDVGEDRAGAGERDRLGGGEEGEGGGEHRVAGADAERLQRKHQGVGAVGAGDRVLDAAVGRQRSLELLHLGAHDVAAMVEHLVNARVDPVAQGVVLGFQVDELHLCSGCAAEKVRVCYTREARRESAGAGDAGGS